MIELLLPYVFDTLEYSWVKTTISICTLADYFVAKKRKHPRHTLVHHEPGHAACPQHRRPGPQVFPLKKYSEI
jgi:hypothetical protein